MSQARQTRNFARIARGRNHDSRLSRDTREMLCSPRLAHKAPVMRDSDRKL